MLTFLDKLSALSEAMAIPKLSSYLLESTIEEVDALLADSCERAMTGDIFSQLCLCKAFIGRVERVAPLGERAAYLYDQSEAFLTRAMCSCLGKGGYRGPLVSEATTGIMAQSLGFRKSAARRMHPMRDERLLACQHPDVIERLLANPNLRVGDVVRIASRRPTQSPVLERIIASRWLCHYEIRVATALNPALTTSHRLRLLPTLRETEARLCLDRPTTHPIERRLFAYLFGDGGVFFCGGFAPTPPAKG